MLSFTVLLFISLIGQSNAAEPEFYNIPEPNLYSGFSKILGQSCFGQANMRVLCFPGSILVDFDNGANNLSNRFLAWNTSQEEPLELTFYFSSSGIQTLTNVTIYFLDDSSSNFGLPSITLAAIFKQGGSMPLVHTEKIYSTQNSQLKFATLSFTLSAKITELILQFAFNNTDVDWVLVSEVGFNANPMPYTQITFQQAQMEQITLGPDNPVSTINITCSVAVFGTFQWTWQYNNNSLPLDSRFTIDTLNNTRVSILSIDELQFSDEGSYTCVINCTTQSNSESRTISLVLKTDIVADKLELTANTSELVTLSCEMYGYLQEDMIDWQKDGQSLQSGARYSIITLTSIGSKQAQNGRPSSGLVSRLTINQLEESDAGQYTCRIPTVTAIFSNITLKVLKLSVPMISTTVQNSTVFVVPSRSISATMSPIDTALPTEAIIGIALGIFLLAILVILLVACCILIKKGNSYTLDKSPSTPQEPVYAEVNKPVQRPPPSPPVSFKLIPTEEFEVPQENRKNRSDSLIQEAINTLESAADPAYQEIDLAFAPIKITAAASIVPSSINPTYEPIDPNITNTDSDDKQSSLVSTPQNHHAHVAIDPSMFSVSEDVDTHPRPNVYMMPYPSAYAEPVSNQRSIVTEVTHDNIKMIKEIGEGRYGMVFLGHTTGLSIKQLGFNNSTINEATNVVFVIKTLKDNSDQDTIEAFKKEVKFMGRLHHENVISLVAACLVEKPFMILEYMENGDLSQYLQNQNFTLQETRPLPTGEVNAHILNYIAYQISCGMKYLASLNFIHRDLAARNCFIGSNYKIKIADFGMTHNLYSSVYFQLEGKAMLPIRWMAYECYFGKFSEKTDVWSFGITMWEIFTFCKKQPFDNLSDQEVIQDAFRGPERTILPKPDACPSNVFEVVLQCWIHDPEKRPTFETVHALLSKIHNLSESAYSL